MHRKPNPVPSQNLRFVCVAQARIATHRKDRALSEVFLETAIALQQVSRSNEHWRIAIESFKSEDGQETFDQWDAHYFERIVKLRLKMSRQKRIFSNLHEDDRESRIKKHKNEVMETLMDWWFRRASPVARCIRTWIANFRLICATPVLLGQGENILLLCRQLQRLGDESIHMAARHQRVHACVGRCVAALASVAVRRRDR